MRVLVLLDRLWQELRAVTRLRRQHVVPVDDLDRVDEVLVEVVDVLGEALVERS